MISFRFSPRISSTLAIFSGDYDLAREVFDRGYLNHYATTMTRLSDCDRPLTTCQQVYRVADAARSVVPWRLNET